MLAGKTTYVDGDTARSNYYWVHKRRSCEVSWRFVQLRKRPSIYFDAPMPSTHSSKRCQLVELHHHHGIHRFAASWQVRSDLWSDLTCGWPSKGTAWWPQQFTAETLLMYHLNLAYHYRCWYRGSCWLWCSLRLFTALLSWSYLLTSVW